MSLSLKRIDVVVLFVTELARARTFYREALGMSMTFEDEVSAYFESETASLLLLSISEAESLLSKEAVAVQPHTGAGSQLVSFVDDVDGVYRDLVARGVVFIREPIDRAWGLRTAHFKDPDGHIWEIAQSLTPD